MLTVSQLGRKYNLSRTTILYYEREGLLSPDHRSDSGYRLYGKAAEEKLEAIVGYRSYGMPVKEIATLLNERCGNDLEQMLNNQFAAIERQIEVLREQQKGICVLLGKAPLLEKTALNKESWLKVCHAAGFDDETLENWHRQFEKVQPDAHEQFLASLHIDPDEIREIRNRARS